MNNNINIHNARRSSVLDIISYLCTLVYDIMFIENIWNILTREMLISFLF